MYIEVFFFLLLLTAADDVSFDYPSKQFPLPTASIPPPHLPHLNVSLFLEVPFLLLQHSFRRLGGREQPAVLLSVAARPRGQGVFSDSVKKDPVLHGLKKKFPLEKLIIACRYFFV